MADWQTLLSCWHKLEHYTPAELPKDKSIKQLQEKLPWNLPFTSKDEKKTIVYTIYFDVHPLSTALEFVREYFQDESLVVEVNKSLMYYASLKLNEQGRYIQNSLGISTFPWALHQLEEGKLQSDSWSESFQMMCTNLLEHLEQNQNELEDDFISYLSEVQTLDNLREIQSIIRKRLGWKTDLVGNICMKANEVYKSAVKEDDIKPGKVWLVGAGPSDPGLFTLKGKRVLQKAEVVVYDALAGQAILSMIPEDAEKINVGKRASHHLMPQEEINKILVKKALEGKRVVRLKGGDPFLFGRGGEELELLKVHQIPYEVVPGVTSAIAVPAYNGIPVTHRDFCSSVHIITGHKKKGDTYDIDFEALVRTKGTLVFLMGVTALADICDGLLKAGMRADMPAAILQQGTTAGQKRISATVSTLPEEVQKQGIQTPAIIVVGEVCALADRFAWHEALPLAGRKILVTRPKELISQMAEKLRREGAEVLELPAIKTEAKYGSYSKL